MLLRAEVPSKRMRADRQAVAAHSPGCQFSARMILILITAACSIAAAEKPVYSSIYCIPGIRPYEFQLPCSYQP